MLCTRPNNNPTLIYAGASKSNVDWIHFNLQSVYCAVHIMGSWHHKCEGCRSIFVGDEILNPRFNLREIYRKIPILLVVWTYISLATGLPPFAKFRRDFTPAITLYITDYRWTEELSFTCNFPVVYWNANLARGKQAVIFRNAGRSKWSWRKCNGLYVFFSI